MLSVDSLYIYPVKGVRAVSIPRVSLRLRGPEHDRRWLITDEDGRFITQRQHGVLATITVVPGEDGLTLSAPGQDDLRVAIPVGETRHKIVVWKDSVNALEADARAGAWLSEVIGIKVRLFFMDTSADRTTSGRWGPRSPVSFADGYPLLVTTTASLDALNDEIEESGGDRIGMNRFRPNIVINCDAPWAEDNWGALAIGGTVIDLVKPCIRCGVTTRDQQTGERQSKEPLKTLARLRRAEDPRLSGVSFGWNATVRTPGTLSQGDHVQVLGND